ncbi:iron-containing alcohol dehydrogenase [Desulfovibrio inopinatus]|uniref:iron-containing alcohol dehydrogenase n=1 Tax=Desulfovibrio inopinatus TaxID=102109 RepID=UPI000427AEEC|nr:iron-containing alcohol dehydrogenase [Desulfovibrio inopinatus]
MHFQFSTASRIQFGCGTIANLCTETAARGKRILLVTGSRPQRHNAIKDDLLAHGLDILVVPIAGEPDTETILEASTCARRDQCDAVVAIGGGSVIDAGKALSALLTNHRNLYDYLEVIGKGMPLENAPAPCIAVPTTAGTGAEVTANAVLASTEHGVKVSMRHKAMIPDLAIVDPELTLDMPPHITASTGMDALTQLLEAMVSRFANPMTTALCREALPRAARSLPIAFANPGNIQAREDMSLAALFSGIALANAKLGAVHGFAAPIGGEFHAAHGAICAALLPAVMETNLTALEQRDPQNPAYGAFIEAAILLSGNPSATVYDSIGFIRSLTEKLHIHGLASIGITDEHHETIATKAARASSMKGNPVELTHDELLAILKKSM